MNQGTTRHAYVGTYTQNAPGGMSGEGPGRGIYVYDAPADRAPGDLAPSDLGPAHRDPADRGPADPGAADRGAQWTLIQVIDTPNPSFLARHPTGRFLYAINEIDQHEGAAVGTVRAYAIDKDSGKLSALSGKPARLSGPGPAHVAVSPDGRYLAVALYGAGSFDWFRLREDGHIGELIHSAKQQGSGPNITRQQAAHAHMMRFSPDGRFAIGVDLGSDRLSVFHDEGRQLSLHQRHQIHPGRGPRHVAFHPEGHELFVITEMGGTLMHFGFDQVKGHVLERLAEADIYPAGYTGPRSGSALFVHPCGRYVYTSTRGAPENAYRSDSVVVWRLQDDTREMTCIQRVTADLGFPRELAMAPDATALYALNQRGGTIVEFAIDTASGLLSRPRIVAHVPTPVCMVFTSSPRPRQRVG